MCLNSRIWIICWRVRQYLLYLNFNKCPSLQRTAARVFQGAFFPVKNKQFSITLRALVFVWAPSAAYVLYLSRKEWFDKPASFAYFYKLKQVPKVFCLLALQIKFKTHQTSCFWIQLIVSLMYMKRSLKVWKVAIFFILKLIAWVSVPSHNEKQKLCQN
jgi:hypothetical protein